MKRKAPDADPSLTSAEHSRLEDSPKEPTSPRTPASILFRNAASSVFVVDIPRSLEEAQLSPDDPRISSPAPLPRRIYSTAPPLVPFVLPEPKNAAALQMALAPAALLQDLMTGAAVGAALDEVRGAYRGTMCLPRMLKPGTKHPASREGTAEGRPDERSKKRRKQQPVTKPPEPASGSPDLQLATEPEPLERHSGSQPQEAAPSASLSSDNTTRVPAQAAITTPTPTPSHRPPHIPPAAHPLHGTIAALLPLASSSVPPSSLDLVVLDPPWPNVSARRNRSGASPYATCATMADTVRLLASLPLARWLAPGGLVAVWLTNKHAILPALTDPPGAGVGGGAGGVFSAWGVELVAEWVWVKVTQAGEPVFDVESAYRKPWERLLVARRRGGGGGGRGGGGESGMAQTPGTEPAQKTAVTPRVIAAVPDVHSRKPNLRALFADVLPQGFTAMEVFARNLTAGWWCWGDDVLRFQGGEWWSEEDAKREAAVDDGTL